MPEDANAVCAFGLGGGKGERAAVTTLEVATGLAKLEDSAAVVAVHALFPFKSVKGTSWSNVDAFVWSARLLLFVSNGAKRRVV